MLRFYVTDPKLRRDVLDYVVKHRDRIEARSCQKLVLPTWASVEAHHKYCRDFIKLAGIYSLEDEEVRHYLFDFKYLSFATNQNIINLLFNEIVYGKGEKGLQKKLYKKTQSLLMGSKKTKEVLKAHAYLLWAAGTVNRRDGKSIVKYREIGRQIGRTKDTAKKYVDEVHAMPQTEREIFLKMYAPEHENMGAFEDRRSKPKRKKTYTVSQYDKISEIATLRKSPRR